MATEHFEVGYNSWCVITSPSNSNYVDDSGNNTNVGTLPNALNGWLLPVTSGSMSRAFATPTVNSYFLPDNLTTASTPEVKSSIRSGFGTYTFQGSVEFEMTQGVTGILSNSSTDGQYGTFFRRDSIFHLQFYDGKKTCTMRNCVWNDFSISGSPNSAIRASMGFHSNNGYRTNLDVVTGNSAKDKTYNESDFLLPYWRSGTNSITDFTISFSRNVTPVFLNNSLEVPSYLRVGMMSVSIQITCLSYQSLAQRGSFVIYVGDKMITLNDRVLQSNDYHMTSLSDVGTKSYTWTSISTNAANPVFTIETAPSNHLEPSSSSAPA